MLKKICRNNFYQKNYKCCEIYKQCQEKYTIELIENNATENVVLLFCQLIMLQFVFRVHGAFEIFMVDSRFPYNRHTSKE